MTGVGWRNARGTIGLEIARLVRRTFTSLLLRTSYSVPPTSMPYPRCDGPFDLAAAC
jgi:hypothetical protein